MGFHIDKVGILGVGLIGGSLGMALRERGVAKWVIGIGRNEGRLEQARDLGAIDEYSLDLGECAADLDVLVLCTPVGVMGDVLAPARDRFRPDIIITDAGSTKAGVEQRVLDALQGFGHFVGAHPMAGSEKTGVAHARADLYEGATCAITETKNTNKTALDVMVRLWSAVGAHIVRLSPEDHDRIVARTSHLPHMAAVALVQVLAKLEDPLVRDFIGEGFRDTTRVAAGDETMWRDICLDNNKELAAALRDYRDSIDRILRAVEEGDGEFLEKLMAQMRRIREGMG